MTAPTGPAASSPGLTADGYEDEQTREWGRYVAAVPIDYYGQRAYNPGEPVPVSAVEGDHAWVPAQFVTARDSGEQPPAATSPEPPTIDPATVAAPPVSSPEAPPTDDGSTVTSTEG